MALFPPTAHALPFAVMFDSGLRTMSNSNETEKAIFSTKNGIGAGLGISVDRGQRWRFSIEGRHIRREGERAFAVDRTSPAFRLGHPLTFTMTPAVATAAFRFGKLAGLSPYVSVGGGLMSWKEQSDIAGLIEKSDGRSGLFEAKVGFERDQGWIRLGVEAGMTWVPGAIGVGGISKVYEEKDPGGLFVVGKIGFSRK